MNEFPRHDQDLAPRWGAVALIAGFLLGVPTALALGPLILPILPDWLNDLGKNVAFSVLSGLFLGSATIIILMLSARWQKRH